MCVSYKKLWILLVQKEISKAELRKQLSLSPSTFTKLNRNEVVSFGVLIKICERLDCNIGDIVDVIKTSTDA